MRKKVCLRGTTVDFLKEKSIKLQSELCDLKIAYF